nr:ankyrin repeat domain-containing protein [uncultured Microscilla sp.]
MTESLLNKFYTPNIMMDNNHLFIEAVRSGNLSTVKQHLSKYPEAVNQKNAQGFTPLILAAYYDQLPVVAYLIEQGADISAVDASGNTALMGACFKGYEQLVSQLIALGADVNVRNVQGATALIYACMFDKQAIAQLLLEHGADASIKDTQGNTALDHAKAKGLKWGEELLQV